VEREELGYRREYTLRRANPSRHRTLEVTFPYEVVDREARKKNMSVDDFIKRFGVTVEWGNGDSARYTITERTDSRRQL